MFWDGIGNKLESEGRVMKKVLLIIIPLLVISSCTREKNGQNLRAISDTSPERSLRFNRTEGKIILNLNVANQPVASFGEVSGAVSNHYHLFDNGNVFGFFPSLDNPQMNELFFADVEGTYKLLGNYSYSSFTIFSEKKRGGSEAYFFANGKSGHLIMKINQNGESFQKIEYQVPFESDTFRYELDEEKKVPLKVIHESIDNRCEFKIDWERSEIILIESKDQDSQGLKP